MDAVGDGLKLLGIEHHFKLVSEFLVLWGIYVLFSPIQPFPFEPILLRNLVRRSLFRRLLSFLWNLLVVAWIWLDLVCRNEPLNIFGERFKNHNFFLILVEIWIAIAIPLLQVAVVVVLILDHTLLLSHVIIEEFLGFGVDFIRTEEISNVFVKYLQCGVRTEV
jgi:hypothetical protein